MSYSVSRIYISSSQTDHFSLFQYTPRIRMQVEHSSSHNNFNISNADLLHRADSCGLHTLSITLYYSTLLRRQRILWGLSEFPIRSPQHYTHKHTETFCLRENSHGTSSSCCLLTLLNIGSANQLEVPDSFWG